MKSDKRPEEVRKRAFIYPSSDRKKSICACTHVCVLLHIECVRMKEAKGSRYSTVHSTVQFDLDNVLLLEFPAHAPLNPAQVLLVCQVGVGRASTVDMKKNRSHI